MATVLPFPNEVQRMNRQFMTVFVGALAYFVVRPLIQRTTGIVL